MSNPNNAAVENLRKRLELPLEQPVIAKVLRDKPFEGENRFGKYNLWTLEVEGEERVFFPDKDANDALLAAGLHAGDSVSLTRKAVQNGRKISSHLNLQVVSRRSNGEKERAEDAPFEAPEDGYRDLMQRCLQESLAIIRSVEGFGFTNEDVRSICNCLFIQRARTT